MLPFASVSFPDKVDFASTQNQSGQARGLIFATHSCFSSFQSTEAGGNGASGRVAVRHVILAERNGNTSVTTPSHSTEANLVTRAKQRISTTAESRDVTVSKQQNGARN